MDRKRLVGIVIAGTMLAACGGANGPGTAWGDGSFSSNGERIYFTATSERGTDIDSSGGPGPGGMMMGGEVSCASCHGADANGGVHTMGMEVMDAPSIRWAALADHEADPHVDDTGVDHTEQDVGYDFETFVQAVTKGLHPDGEPLGDDMPRWDISEADLGDLADYLQSLPSQ